MRRFGIDDLPFDEDRVAQDFVKAHPDGASLEKVADALGVHLTWVQRAYHEGLRRLRVIAGTPSPLGQELRDLLEATEPEPSPPGSPSWDPDDEGVPPRALEPLWDDDPPPPADYAWADRQIHPYERLSEDEWTAIAQKMQPGEVYGQKRLETLAGRHLPSFLGLAMSSVSVRRDKRLVRFKGAKAYLPALDEETLRRIEAELDVWERGWLEGDADTIPRLPFGQKPRARIRYEGPEDGWE